MIAFVVGLVLFLGIHSISIVAPDWRGAQVQRRGEGPWKGLYSVVSLASFVLMLYGYGLARAAPVVLWTPPPFLRHVTWLLMLPVFPLLLSAYLPGRIQAAAKHPMLLAVKIWATAHLLCNGTAADVILFSPSIHNSSYHLNVFTHGESEHPGLLSLAERFFARIGRPSDLAALVSDSRNTVNSNYFAARPRFWREWLALTEALYAIAESSDDAMGAQLRAPTAYRGAHAAQMKVFVLERLATWLLVTQARFVARAFDPFAARARIYKLPVAIVCDALKIAYATQGRPQYKDLFFLVQGVRKTLNWQIRAAAFLRTKPVRPAIDALASYWDRSGR